MEFEQIVQERYAVKQFAGKKLLDAQINKLLDLVRYAPSSFNIQPLKVVVVADQKMKEKLSPASWGQPQVASCSHLLVFCANTDIIGNIQKLEQLMLRSGVDADGVKAYVQIMKNFEKGLNQEQKLVWAQKQAYIALGNALNGAVALGFASSPMEGFNPREYAKILKLPANLVPTVLCAVGYAADKPKPKLRFEKVDLFSFI